MYLVLRCHTRMSLECVSPNRSLIEMEVSAPVVHVVSTVVAYVQFSYNSFRIVSCIRMRLTLKKSVLCILFYRVDLND